MTLEALVKFSKSIRAAQLSIWVNIIIFLPDYLLRFSILTNIYFPILGSGKYPSSGERVRDRYTIQPVRFHG